MPETLKKNKKSIFLIGIIAVIVIGVFLLANQGTPGGTTTTICPASVPIPCNSSSTSTQSTTTVCPNAITNPCPTTTTIPTTSYSTTITSTTICGLSCTQPEVTMNLKTWTSQNGYLSINWADINDVQVFHVYPDSSGLLHYDGSNVNVAATIAQAHTNGDIATIAFGGAGLGGYMNTILCSPQLSNTTISNLVNLVTSSGYDGVEIDLENNSYTQSCVTSFTINLVKKLRAQNPNVVVNFVVAGWLSGIDNIPALAPYVTHFHCGFYENGPNAGGCGPSTITSIQSQLSNKNQLSVGFYLPGEGSASALAANMTAVRNMGVNNFYFWAADYAAPFYSTINSNK